MLADERKYQILEMLKKHKSLSVKDLCDFLDASESTIRRDLRELEKNGRLKRTHGGAILKELYTLEYEENVKQKINKCLDEKKEIASIAFTLIKENISIAIDAGTTTLELAKLIGQSELALTVVTNSSDISNALSINPNCVIYLVGGKLKNNTLASVGNYSVDFIKTFNVQIAFIGTNGLSIEKGLTTPDLEEAQIKKAMISISNNVFVLADSSKFGLVALVKISDFSQIDAIITDSKVENGTLKEYANLDINIITKKRR